MAGPGLRFGWLVISLSKVAIKPDRYILFPGHFYALVSSVTVKCADPQAPGANITSYIYTNSTGNTPGVLFSNQSTLLNGAPLVSADARLSGLLAVMVVTAAVASLF